MTAAAAPEKKIVMGFSQVGAESEWRTANTKSIQQAAKDAGIELKFSDAQQQQQNQIAAIRSFIAQKVDVISFSPVVTSGWDTVLQEAKSAGIPVILTDRAVDVKDPSLYVSLIGSDFTLEGERAANWMLKFMDDQGFTNKDVAVAELEGTVGSAPAIDRKKGWDNIMKDHPNWKVVLDQSGDFTRAGGKQVMEAFLKTGKHIDVLFAHNDDMAIGAIQAMKEAGVNPGKDIKIISIDATKGGFQAMMAGELNCVVECNPLLGPQLMEAAKALLSGKTLPRWIKTNEGIFPADVAAKEFPNRQY
jgi:simple sugar transport system substrate-binding protein